MASALFTLADGGGSAVAVGGASQPVGLNVTASNTVNGQIVDMSGVSGYMARTIWNNQGLADQTWSAANFTINQATGAFSFPAGTVEGAAYVVEVTIINYTSTPVYQRAYVGVYVSKQGGYRVAFSSAATTQQALIALLSQPATLPSGDPNAAFILNQATTNGQGSGGPTIVAAVSLVCSASGIFDYAVSASCPTAAAVDVSTWTVTAQTGTGALAFTGNTPVGQGGQFASAAAGTGIVVSSGGGGEITLGSFVKTIGTGAVGDAVCDAGALQNVIGGTTLTPFTRGNNVLLLLKYTNSVANRVVSQMKLSLRERLYA